MFEFQLLRLVLAAGLLLGQGQFIGTAGTTIVHIRDQGAQVAQTASNTLNPKTFLWIGMRLEAGDSLLVLNVAPNTIASRYNFRTGDRIAKVQEVPVDSMLTLTAALADKQRPAVLVEVVRDGHSFELLLARPQRKAPPATVAAVPKNLSPPTESQVSTPVSRSLNLTTSAGTLVIVSHLGLSVQPQEPGPALTAVSAAYYDHAGKLNSLTCEGDSKTVRSRLDQLPLELRSPAQRWLDTNGQE